MPIVTDRLARLFARVDLPGLAVVAAVTAGVEAWRAAASPDPPTARTVEKAPPVRVFLIERVPTRTARPCGR